MKNPARIAKRGLVVGGSLWSGRSNGYEVSELHISQFVGGEPIAFVGGVGVLANEDGITVGLDIYASADVNRLGVMRVVLASYECLVNYEHNFFVLLMLLRCDS